MILQTGRPVQLTNTPADLLAFVRSENRRTIEGNSFEIPARVKTDPILNNYLTQTMENNGRSGVRRLLAEMSFIFIFSTVVRIEKICVVFLSP